MDKSSRVSPPRSESSERGARRMSQRYAIRWTSKSGCPLYLREAVGRRQWMIYLEDASSFDWATGNRVLDALGKPEDGRFGMVELGAPRHMTQIDRAEIGMVDWILGELERK